MASTFWVIPSSTIRVRRVGRSCNYSRLPRRPPSSAAAGSIEVGEEVLGESGPLIVVPSRDRLDIRLGEWPNDERAGHRRSAGAMSCRRFVPDESFAVARLRSFRDPVRFAPSMISRCQSGTADRLGRGRDSVPERLQIVDLLVDREVVESGRRKRDRPDHVEQRVSIAPSPSVRSERDSAYQDVRVCDADTFHERPRDSWTARSTTASTSLSVMLPRRSSVMSDTLEPATPEVPFQRLRRELLDSRPSAAAAFCTARVNLRIQELARRFHHRALLGLPPVKDFPLAIDRPLGSSSTASLRAQPSSAARRRSCTGRRQRATRTVPSTGQFNTSASRRPSRSSMRSASA